MTQDDVPHRFAVDFAGATLLGIYRVEKKIADGGMGSVWLAEDTNLGRQVVIKVPHVRFLGESGFRTRFTREITELVRLEHPNIVRILAQGTHEEIPFFVLQYLRGGSLEDRLEGAGEAPRGTDAVVPWLRTIADTLDFVHGRGVIHRDVKPENILFDEEGHVFLSDFGVAKAIDKDVNVTEVGTGIGSPKYMAPEQGLGRAVDGAADQYGLATTVYEAIAGRIPFEGVRALEILLSKQKHAPLELAATAPGLPAGCADAVMRALAADPAERFSSCGDFADAFLAGAGALDRTPSAGVPFVAEPRRGRLAAVSVALVAALVLALGYTAGWFSSETRTLDGGRAGEDETAYEVVLLSPGAEPRRLLRYGAEPGSVETTSIGIATRHSKQLGEQAPSETSPPRVGIRLRVEVRDVAEDGDISFSWQCEKMSLDPAAGTPPPIQEALRQAAQSFEGRSGTARQSARGIYQEVTHDTPPPERADLLPLFATITEIVEQLSTPLPEEPVGVGARWEVTYARQREGIRLTQTMTFELESLAKNEAQLRIYAAVAGLNQTFEHPEAPSDADVRLQSGHGEGEGEITIDFDRLGDRRVRMSVVTRMKYSVMDGSEDGAGEKELFESRELNYESDR